MSFDLNNFTTYAFSKQSMNIWKTDYVEFVTCDVVTNVFEIFLILTSLLFSSRFLIVEFSLIDLYGNRTPEPLVFQSDMVPILNFY